jgi:hypothetical protein
MLVGMLIQGLFFAIGPKDEIAVVIVSMVSTLVSVLFVCLLAPPPSMHSMRP